MSNATQIKQQVAAKPLTPLSPAEILTRDGRLSAGNESFAAIEEQFAEPVAPTRSIRPRSRASELTAYIKAHPLTRQEIAAKEAAAELRDPKLIATHDGRFVVPKPLEKVQPAIPPAPQMIWE